MSTVGALDLGNLALSRKEDFRAFVDAPRRTQPERLSRAQLDALDRQARSAYNAIRRQWHANLGPIRTPQLAALHEDLWDILDSNQQDGDKAKGAVAATPSRDWARPPRCSPSPAPSITARSPSTGRSPPAATNGGRCAGWG